MPARLLAIKLGELPYSAVADQIECLLLDIEAAAERSTLQENADQAWINDFVEAAHRTAVRCGAGSLRLAA